jgi:hypothetical protein
MLTFDSSKHKYYWEGRSVPSVTTILSVIAKPALTMWAAKQAGEYIRESLFPGDTMDELSIQRLAKEAVYAHRKKAEEAASIGTIVHKHAEGFIEAYMNRRLYQHNITQNSVQKGYQAFLDWFYKSKVEPLHTEYRIFNKDLWYAGTVDLICRIGDELCIVDYKTSTGIYPEYYLQLAAYQHTFEIEKGVSIDKRIIVRFDKQTGEFESKTDESNNADNMDAFKAAITLFNWSKKK